ncbi:MAG: tyrosine-type recombinase/integrase [Lachnospiraceae bacterium]|nr:tyrosine-type recombinase/integrase [Lachnospiraceae bacterium]
MGRLKDEPLFQLIHDFLKIYLPNQRCCSPNTIKSYRTVLNQLLEYISNENHISFGSLTFEMLTTKAITGYLEWLVTEKSCCSRTRNHRLVCISSFFSYTAIINPENVILHNNISKIPRQKTEKFAGVEYMSEEAVRILLEQPVTSTQKGVRDQFFMILLYDTGARIQEMLDIRICDMRLSKISSVQLHGKGSKIRSVPLMHETVSHFMNYKNIFHAGENEYSQTPLFYVEQHGVKHAMSDDNVRKFMKKYRTLAREICMEVPENVHPHLWRHSRAMHLYQHGMDLTLIAQWLGHSSLETSLIYAHADTEQKRKAIEKSMGREVIGGVNPPKYSITDEELLKRLCGLK